MASAPVRQAIAKRAGVPFETLQISAPLTRAAAAGARGERQPEVDVGHPQVDRPVPDQHLRQPDRPDARHLRAVAVAQRRRRALANAAVDELRGYLGGLASTEQTPAKDQIQIVQLGRAEGAVINGGVHWQAALLAFFLTFAAASATVIFLARVRTGWREAADDERLADADAAMAPR